MRIWGRNTMLLDVRGLNVIIEGLPILHDVSLAMEQGEIVAVVGSNGAGKTTLLRTIIGLVQSSRGQIWFAGKEITHLPPSHIVRQGLSSSWKDVSYFLICPSRKIF